MILLSHIKNELTKESARRIKEALREAVGRLVDQKDHDGVHLSISKVADAARLKAKSLEEEAQGLRDAADRAERLKAQSEQ